MSLREECIWCKREGNHPLPMESLIDISMLCEHCGTEIGRLNQKELKQLLVNLYEERDINVTLIELLAESNKLKHACSVIETYIANELGSNVQVVFEENHVKVSSSEWNNTVNGIKLHKTLIATKLDLDKGRK